MNPLLEVRIQSAGYAQRIVLENIGFSICQGEWVAVLGLNGCGKSTLLRSLGASLAHFDGSISLAGNDFGRLPSKLRARLVAGVPQTAIRVSGMTVRQMVLLGRYPWLGPMGFFGPRDYQEADNALQATALEPLAQREVQTLSGGEWQRALLARALAQLGSQPTPVLLLDELNAGLDLARTMEIFSLLEMRRRAGLTIIMAIHDFNLAALFATHLLGIRHGKMLFFERTTTAFNKANLQELYDLQLVFSPGARNIPQAWPGLPDDVAAAIADRWSALPDRKSHSDRR